MIGIEFTFHFYRRVCMPRQLLIDAEQTNIRTKSIMQRIGGTAELTLQSVAMSALTQCAFAIHGASS